MSSYVPLNHHQHAKLRVSIDQSRSLARGQHMIPLFAAEFVQASAEFPIVFVKDRETGQIRPVLLAGLKPGENLFYRDDHWLADYTPASLITTPFALVPNSADDAQWVVCVDEQSAQLSDTDGELLFTGDGEQSAFLQAQTELAVQRRTLAEQTEQFTAMLLELNLIKANPLTVHPPGQEPYSLEGVYVVDDEVLEKLPGDSFVQLRDRGYLAPVYAHRASLHRLDKLMAIQTVN